MNGSFLLDTNIVIAMFADSESVRERVAEAAAVYVPVIVLGELYYGAMRSGNSTRNLARIDDFAVKSSVLVCDEETSRHYGQIKNSLRQRGRPLPENDIWIGAIAMQHDLVLVTRDTHFREIDGLKLDSW